MGRTEERLGIAVARGIITAEQAVAIQALELAPTATGARSEGAEPPARALDVASIGYVLGAITVVAAMAWFLADRWEWLGPGGALATTLLYGAILVVTSRLLAREGFATASGLALVLAVGTVPVATIAANALLDWYVRVPAEACRVAEFDFLACRGEELLAELVTILAALVALRRVHFAMLALPIAGLSVRLVFHLADLLGANTMGLMTQGWVWAIAASLAAAAAYAAERRQPAGLDLAFWLHLVAVVCAVPATLQVAGSEPSYKHLLVAGALVAFAFALFLRRFAWLALGMLWFTGYIVWLASSVFRDTPAFPIVLAALGVAVIVMTVWVQRNAARLAARFGIIASTGRPRFPGGVALLIAPALVAALMIPFALREDAEREAAMRWNRARMERQARAEHRAVPETAAHH